MMFKDLRAHKADYSLLALVATIFTFTFLAKRNEPGYLLYLTCGFAGAYVLWGIWHHSRAKSLSSHVMLEYVLVGLLSILIVSTLLL